MAKLTEHQRHLMLQAGMPPDFLDPALERRRLFAEFWGTFLLVLAAAGGSLAAETSGEITKSVAAIAPGIMVMAVIYFMGAVSGAHLNPAVTLAFALRRNFPWYRVPGYVIVQLLGGLAAAFFLHFVFDFSIATGGTHPGEHISQLKALAVEVVLTTGLVNTILGTASGARNIGSNGAIAVGGYIALSGLWAEALTGASMNPSRSLGPDIVSGSFHDTWIYIIGPLLGSMIGVLFEWILKGKPTLEGTKTAQGDGH